MSILGGKPFMQPGGDPFLALQIKRQQETLVLCDERWTSQHGRASERVSEAHKCGRVFGHRASHVCGCGATKHTQPKRRRKP